MKKIALATAIVGTMMLTGCAAPYSSGLAFSSYDRPLSVRDNATACSKEGKSSMVNILGLIATGDASVAKAKSNAGITKVGSVDTNYNSILGIISTTTTVVCGE